MGEIIPGKLIVVSGPSGAGKSTVINKAMDRRGDLCFSVSATTRLPRPGEKNGVDYFFVTPEKFAGMVTDGALLEHAEYVGNRYGTPRDYVEKKLSEGYSVILDIEVQGASQVRFMRSDAVCVFILPPSSVELERRLRGRKTDSEDKIQCRLKQAKRECSEAPKYDYIIVNDDPDKAAEELCAIISAEKCRARDCLHLASAISDN